MNIRTYLLGFAILLVGALIIVYVSNVESVKGHETSHLQNNNYFGVESHIVYNDFGLSGVTYADTNFNNTEDWRAAYTVHGINEAIGYQLTPLFIGIMGLLILIITTLIFGFIYIGDKIEELKE